MSHGNHHGRPVSDEEPVFTTLALGEEGDPDPTWPGEVTTMALGEEGDTDPDLCLPVWAPDEPVMTTMALGEEGDPDPDLWGA
jgi:hypothetical protein